MAMSKPWFGDSMDNPDARKTPPVKPPPDEKEPPPVKPPPEKKPPVHPPPGETPPEKPPPIKPPPDKEGPPIMVSRIAMEATRDLRVADGDRTIENAPSR
jgi:hypothetical protein